MENERDREEYKHVCKLCNKRYPSGKSLGGHMRSHVIANSKLNKAAALLKNNNNNINNNNNKVPTFVTVVDDVVDDDDVDEDDVDEDEDEDEYLNDQKERENGGHSGYGLRENPKKTWRIVDSGINNKPQHQQQPQQPNSQHQERVCKQCGKGFQSLKALCGHMSSHSEKDRNFHKEEEEDDDDNSWSSESHSDDHHTNNKKKKKNKNNNKFEEEGFIPSKRQTRSSMSRYRSLTAVDSLGGSSSNNSEIDQLEQEEVAICLMMLSRDSSSSYHHHKTSCFNHHLATESSDNNSVILEGGSSSNFVVGGMSMSMSKRKDLNLMNGGNCTKKIKQQVNVEMDNSDSGYFENGAKELESDDSVDGYARNYSYSTYGLNKFKNSTTNNNNKVDLGSGFVDSYDDYSKKRVRDVVGNFGFDSPELEENNSRKKMKQDYYHESSNKYECVICNKTFKNHQALGGHIISHRRNGDNHHTTLETSNSLKFSSAKNFGASASTSTNNVATTSKTMLNNYAKKGSGSKKMKGHKCPYCPKVFKSGQALGGHKRSHMIGAGASLLLDRSPAPPPPPPPPPPPEPEQRQQQPLIDLNFPPAVEEEGSGNSQFVTW